MLEAHVPEILAKLLATFLKEQAQEWERRQKRAKEVEEANPGYTWTPFEPDTSLQGFSTWLTENFVEAER
jgi:hypothetical protein